MPDIARAAKGTSFVHSLPSCGQVRAIQVHMSFSGSDLTLRPLPAFEARVAF